MRRLFRGEIELSTLILSLMKSIVCLRSSLARPRPDIKILVTRKNLIAEPLTQDAKRRLHMMGHGSDEKRDSFYNYN